MNKSNIFSKLLIYLLSVNLAHAFWEEDQWWYIEHQFSYENATFQINKQYIYGNQTVYTFKLNKLDDGYQGIRVGFQWVMADGNYTGMVFQMKIPETGIKSNGMLEKIQESHFYPNQNNGALTEYIKQKIIGNYLKDDQEELDIKDIEVYVNRNGDFDGTKLQITFKRDGHETLGQNKFWMAWEQYNAQGGNCETTGTCLSLERVKVRDRPFIYYNGVEFGDWVARQFIMTSYWIIGVAGLFGIFGLPLNLLVWSVLNLLYFPLFNFVSFFTVLIA